MIKQTIKPHTLLGFLKKNILIVLLFLFMLPALVLDSSFFTFKSDTKDIEKIESVLKENLKVLSNEVDVFFSQINKDSTEISIYDKIADFQNQTFDDSYVYLIYNREKLIYWSDNIPILPDYFSDIFSNKVIFLGNGWYQAYYKTERGITVVGLSLIKREYNLTNPLLKDYFLSSIKLNPNDTISLNENEGFQVHLDEEFVFSVIKSNDSSNSRGTKSLVVILYFFSILLLVLILVSWFINNLKGHQLLRSSLFLIAVGLVRWLLYYFEIPHVFYGTSLFEPHYFAESELFSSLGNFLLNSIFILCIVYYFYKEEWQLFNPKNNKRSNSFILVLLFVALTLFFVLVETLIQSLIENSTIVFEVHKIFDVTFSTLIGFLIISFLILAFFLLLDKVILVAHEIFGVRVILIVSLVFGILYFCASLFCHDINFYSSFFLILFFISSLFIRKRGRKPVYSTLIFYLFTIALFTVIIITETNEKKENGKKEVIAVNLANERDPLAETFLNNIEDRMIKDSVLLETVFSNKNDVDELYNIVIQKYFSGYWTKYEVQIYLCGDNDSIQNEFGNESFLCRDFFDEIISEQGIIIPGSDFFFIDNMNGRISYLGELNFINSVDSTRLSLFIDLNTVVNARMLGYPELLLESSKVENDILSDYSYAKYKDGILVSRVGEYEYSLNDNLFKSESEFSIINESGYDHMVYCFGENITIVVSSSSVRILDYLIMLSYIFVFFHIIFTVLVFVYKFPNQFIDFRLDFKNKIQFTMISILFLSLLLIGGGTIYFNVKQYSDSQLNNISEKIQSVLIELEHKLANEEELNYEYQEYLTYLLVKFSNVFYTDINVYNTEGNLLASSRGEIFDNLLISPRMNSEAFREIHYLKKGRYIHEEQIGELKYLSAYAAFSNNSNRILAYLNLPHFTNQKVLQEEVFGLITAIINIYVFLVLLTILVTIFITNKITQPLKLIRDKMHAVKLGRENEKIEYNSKDEIGSLIDDYNRMIDELHTSADLLMKSERESAWREMAKQIAHEIKNPLTPMRLQLQHLQKARNDNAPDWEDRFMHISEVIINQIDALSAISTEFSNFAQMPKANNKEMNLSESLKEIVSLFNEDEKDNIIIDSEDDHNPCVIADKEQIQRVFINLIKNAIQSVPEGIKPDIHINIFRKDSDLIVEVKDNGKGISEELRGKLFEPSFTTKTSGTGLGLAIVKRIVEPLGGKIWYETTPGRGSSFFVSLPEFKES